MIHEYSLSCKCGFKQKIEYGRDGLKILEIYSCPTCKNLFSLGMVNKKECIKCKGSLLVSYNPNKKENIGYYRDMFNQKKILKSQLDQLEVFWGTIKDNECPKCGKKQLVWFDLTAEAEKKKAEAERMLLEKAKKKAEIERIKAEKNRKLAEKKRLVMEKKRNAVKNKKKISASKVQKKKKAKSKKITKTSKKAKPKPKKR